VRRELRFGPTPGSLPVFPVIHRDGHDIVVDTSAWPCAVLRPRGLRVTAALLEGLTAELRLQLPEYERFFVHVGHNRRYVRDGGKWWALGSASRVVEIVRPTGPALLRVCFFREEWLVSFAVDPPRLIARAEWFELLDPVPSLDMESFSPEGKAPAEVLEAVRHNLINVQEG
jgi:hypothetical protein